MPTIARFIGGAGTGKTRMLLDTLEKVLESHHPLQVGFVSFTRAARREASERAGDRFGVPACQLETDGWFRTLHSVCYRMLGIPAGQLISGSKADRKWLAESLGVEVSSMGIPDEGLDEQDVDDTPFESATDASIALGLWHAARNRLEPLRPTWELASQCSDSTPDYDWCVETIKRYEQCKRLDDRCDFTDLVSRYAGYKCTVDGVERITPEGDVPRVPVWFFDEQQDTSALLDTVCHRLIADAYWVYVCGDPFQSIYQWAGASPKHFLAWDVAKSKIMPQSWRCAPAIHELGENFLRLASDYWDRGIKPASHDGSVDIVRYQNGTIPGEVTEGESWLILARTNFHARRLSARLDDTGLPWAPIRGNGGWNRPKTNRGLECLAAAEQFGGVVSDFWADAVPLLPTKHDGKELLTRGTKTLWSEPKHRASQKGRQIALEALGEWGATPDCIAMIRSGAWAGIINRADLFRTYYRNHGSSGIYNPQIRVGTIHSAKGAEADNVLWLTTSSLPIARGSETEDGRNEECRVSYVAATRARKRLIVAVEPNKRHRAELPA